MADATAGQAVASAQAHLNDVGATIWPYSVLLPFLQEAHRELRARVTLNGIPVIDEVSAVLPVPAGVNDISTILTYPSDIIIPIWMKERQQGQANDDFIDMTPRDFLPNVNPDIWLFWWCWRNEKILTLGSLNNEEVQIRYRRQIPTPNNAGDSLGWLGAENYLSFRTAALACNSIGEIIKGQGLTAMADANMDLVIRLNVKQIQSLPARRRPYHRRYSNNSIIRGI